MTSENKNEKIVDKAQLTDYIASGCKPEEDWRIGTEHEKFAFDLKTLKPLTYEGGIRKLLENLVEYGWEPVIENGLPIALTMPDHSSVTLEPGGQVELSGAPLETIHQTCREVTGHIKQVKEVADKMGAGFLGLGYQPKWSLDDVEWMPKGRYKIMREYMPKRGTLGHHMMLATCTVQVNLDFRSEHHMVEMFRAALALQPLATALWANSPFKDGKKNDFLSYRSHIWTDTDPDRCGVMPFVFEDNFGFESYVDYMLDVPMYFVYRDGQYIDASGQSFRDFMAGKLPALPGETPGIKDWEDHLTTAFPEVRLKKFIEMRGADGGPSKNLCALPAFWVGLLYDDQALADVTSLISDWSYDEVSGLRDQVPVTALKTPFRGGTLQDLAKDVLEISKQGLSRRAKLDGSGQDETVFLNPLHAIAQSGVTPAEEMLALFDGDWGGSVDAVFKDYAY
ncbi:MAG: glutamate--cysteine ligase [Rhodospirillaceae bacterium]|jgi:glutamate--cysteine ligase|nr:glutamate--cysteine ligase [Rhodospirillaceae bacterium]MBT4589852.1 glutamate--cysteine ligase [Rhodospirillaceae bacterium]MBT4940456.1 glutamate--cysteine ligase [Rhodospirillaceae bacterium]MBT5939158.1 glutamate--cysteine ligase [Rhodospirillaceae bacterium]MBT7267435.1 glutamate--cysteine ligase [Rhodospirillaceae bacterium]